MSKVVTGNKSAAELAYLIPLSLIGVLIGLSLLPRIAYNDGLFNTHLIVISFLLVWFIGLQVRLGRHREPFKFVFNIVPSHYVQGLIQITIFIYWSWYWELISHNSVLIISQLLFAYLFDALLHWSRKKVWRFGFGPFPITLSTNLFLCFKDEWFYLQFLVIAFGLVVKEFVTWQRDGRRVHIFNPSAITLFMFSVVLIFTDNTNLTWAEEIATRLNDPQYIYSYIFFVGLIVQYLFGVTLVTLFAGVALFLANIIYTSATGVYWFLDSGIPIAVFLGMHLLVTDPATSPKKNLGKAMFGALYGLGVFGLYGLLGLLEKPTFYDKLLCVPLLNLFVRFFDQIGAPNSLLGRILQKSVPEFCLRLNSRQLNRVFMFIWIILFILMYQTNIVGTDHPGRSITFWQKACSNDNAKACKSLSTIYFTKCYTGNAQQCSALADLYRKNIDFGQSELDAIQAQAAACDFGSFSDCNRFVQLYDNKARMLLLESCDENGKPLSCYVYASAIMKRLDKHNNIETGLSYFIKGCEKGLAVSCVVSGYLHLNEKYQNLTLAKSHFLKACNHSNGLACYTLSKLNNNQTDQHAAEWYRTKACLFGIKEACQHTD